MPRTCTLASVPVVLSGKEATTTTSGLTREPAAGRATPGATSRIFTCSTVTLLSISDVAPARRTIAFSGEPDETSVAWKPRAMASMATNTATVPAMPSTATTADGQRSRTLLTL